MRKWDAIINYQVLTSQVESDTNEVGIFKVLNLYQKRYFERPNVTFRMSLLLKNDHKIIIIMNVKK